MRGDGLCQDDGGGEHKNWLDSVYIVRVELQKLQKTRQSIKKNNRFYI